LNARFRMDTTVQIGGRSTYWDPGKQFFMYYQSTERRWAISFHDDDAWRASHGRGEDPLSDAQRGGTRGLACEAQKGGATWHEFVDGEWHRIAPAIQKLSLGSRAPPLEPLPAIPPPLPAPTPSQYAAPSAQQPLDVKSEPPVHAAVGSTAAPRGAAPSATAEAAAPAGGGEPCRSAPAPGPTAPADRRGDAALPPDRPTAGGGQSVLQPTSAAAGSSAAEPAAATRGLGDDLQRVMAGAATPVLSPLAHPKVESDDDSSSTQGVAPAAVPTSAAGSAGSVGVQQQEEQAVPTSGSGVSKPLAESSSWEDSAEARRRKKRLKTERKRRKAEAQEARIRARLLEELHAQGPGHGSKRRRGPRAQRGGSEDDAKESKRRRTRESAAPDRERKPLALVARAAGGHAAEGVGAAACGQPSGSGGAPSVALVVSPPAAFVRRRRRWRAEVAVGWPRAPERSDASGDQRC